MSHGTEQIEPNCEKPDDERHQTPYAHVHQGFDKTTVHVRCARHLEPGHDYKTASCVSAVPRPRMSQELFPSKLPPFRPARQRLKLLLFLTAKHKIPEVLGRIGKRKNHGSCQSQQRC